MSTVRRLTARLLGCVRQAGTDRSFPPRPFDRASVVTCVLMCACLYGPLYNNDLHLAHRHLPTVESLLAPRALPPTRSAVGWPT